MTDPSLCSSPSVSQSSPELFPVEEEVDSSSSHVTDFLRGRASSSLPSLLSSHLSITLVNHNCQSHLSIRTVNHTCQSNIYQMHLSVTPVNHMSVMSITSTYHICQLQSSVKINNIIKPTGPVIKIGQNPQQLGLKGQVNT